MFAALLLLFAHHAPADPLPIQSADPLPIEAVTPAPSPPTTNPGTLPRTYALAYAQAVEQGKSLIVWSGEAICMPCIRHNHGEFVCLVLRHSHPDAYLFPKDGLTVGIPVQGKLMMAGQVETWPDGHIPTVREILRRWRADRQTTTRMEPPGAAPWQMSGGRPGMMSPFGRRVVPSASGPARGMPEAPTRLPPIRRDSVPEHRHGAI